MPALSEPLWNKAFSHIYVEEEALGYPLAERALSVLNSASVIPIKHYKDIFNRHSQDFNAQKKSPKLILAVRRDKFLFPGANVCERYGHDNFFYAPQMMNCLYDCEYCYLRGMLNSANVLVFVNTNDYFSAALNAAPAYISVSYSSDMLALEPIFGLAGEWLAFASKNPALTLEIRTKAGYFNARAYKPFASPNIILAWTLSPEEDISRYEQRAPALANRLSAMKAAIDAGFNTRLCVDPVLISNGWETRIENMARSAREIIDTERLYDISVGGFRVSKTHYKRMVKKSPGSIIRTLPLAENGGVISYGALDEARVKAHVTRALS